MKKKYFALTILTLFFVCNIQSQTEFKKDSIHLFSWDNYNNDWLHNTREYLTYNNGGIKETNLRRQFLSGSSWVNYYQFNKAYTANNTLEENIRQGWNDPNSGWNDKSKDSYEFDDNQNETLHQYSLFYSGAWNNYQREQKSYVDNNLYTKTLEQYDSASMEFVPEEHYIYYYTDGLLDYEIKRIYFRDVAAWENSEKIDYTYNSSSQLTNIERFGFNSTTGEFSGRAVPKTTLTYSAEGLIEESIIQIWGTSQYINTDRIAYTYLAGNQTEILMQSWNNSTEQWVNSSRQVRVFDGDNNEIELVYESWNTSANPNAWKGFLRIVNYWSPAITLGVNNPIVKDNGMKIYPNPASEYLNISSIHDISTVEIYDLLGKQVLKLKNSHQIKVNNLSTGMYLVKLNTSQGETTKKLIIE